MKVGDVRIYFVWIRCWTLWNRPLFALVKNVAGEQGKDAAQMDTCVNSMTNYYNKCKKFLQTIFLVWISSADNFFLNFWFCKQFF